MQEHADCKFWSMCYDVWVGVEWKMFGEKRDPRTTDSYVERGLTKNASSTHFSAKRKHFGSIKLRC